jgi:hypothetical protein
MSDSESIGLTTRAVFSGFSLQFNQYKSIEDAVLSVLSDYLAISQGVNKELGGGIFETSSGYFYTDAFVATSNLAPDLPYQIRSEAKSFPPSADVYIAGWWHTHPSPPGDWPGDYPGPGDRRWSQPLGLDPGLGRGYLAGPSGLAISFDGTEAPVIVGSLWETGKVGLEYPSQWGLRVKAE